MEGMINVRAENQTEDCAPVGGSHAGIAEQNLYDARVKENFVVFGGASVLYACLYAFCMYRNESGISYALFVAGSLFYVRYCLKKLEISMKKGSIFYMISMMLLAISTFCTDDGRIIFFNKLGVFLLGITMLLSVFYQTEKWNLSKFLGAIVQSCKKAFGMLYVPFTDAAWYLKNKMDKKNSKYLYILLGLVVTIPLFVVALLLLTSADIVFKNMTELVLKEISFNNILLAAWLVCFMFFASYCLLVQFCKKSVKEEVVDSRKGEPLIAIPVATILSLLYLVFSVVQIMYLFIGNMQLPEGYTYAEYAREGFFQLLAVGILNLALVLAGLRYFRPHKVLKAVLTVMSLCTFIMLVSSAMRMIIYIQYYYLTFLRILVLWSLVVLFLIFAGVVIYTHKESFPLFRYSLVVVTCLYLCLSFSHPDYWIAKVNVASMQEDRSEFFRGEAYEDYWYLSTLCADAAPILQETWQEHGMESGSHGYYWSQGIQERMGDMSLREFNLSRYLMRANATHHFQ